ncbi:hypothetical protein EV132_103344 [Rhizobium sullae]|uniref:Uncharacterized protein n=1 Tax=Rhizobium sullae TaxID=50338 RepID=A0A4R3QBS3_RHISU|nr:hypothetical protein EV132_103344 [Rhizobium sullae]
MGSRRSSPNRGLGPILEHDTQRQEFVTELVGSAEIVLCARGITSGDELLDLGLISGEAAIGSEPLSWWLLDQPEQSASVQHGCPQGSANAGRPLDLCHARKTEELCEGSRRV